jgi:hypothetical protein
VTHLPWGGSAAGRGRQLPVVERRSLTYRRGGACREGRDIIERTLMCTSVARACRSNVMVLTCIIASVHPIDVLKARLQRRLTVAGRDPACHQRRTPCALPGTELTVITVDDSSRTGPRPDGLTSRELIRA